MDFNMLRRLSNVTTGLFLSAAALAPLVLGTVALPTRAIAQSQANTIGATRAPLRFEVASVKRNGSNERRGVTFSPNSLTIVNLPLLNIIIQAYELPPWQMTFGSFDSILEEHYDIVAKAVGPASKEQLRLMLQALLEERFRLKVHHIQKQTSVLALVLDDKAEPGFQRAAPDQEADVAKELGPEVRPQTVKCTNTTMQTLARTLMELAASKSDPYRIVVDKTGLEGGFDFTLRWTRDDGPSGIPAAEDRLPLMIGALRKIGLNLKSDKALVDNLVVDNVERLANEN
jgi:uncharacterized protein (TIGR03435 family)